MHKNWPGEAAYKGSWARVRLVLPLKSWRESLHTFIWLSGHGTLYFYFLLMYTFYFQSCWGHSTGLEPFLWPIIKLSCIPASQTWILPELWLRELMKKQHFNSEKGTFVFLTEAVKLLCILSMAQPCWTSHLIEVCLNISWGLSLNWMLMTLIKRPESVFIQESRFWETSFPTSLLQCIFSTQHL